MQSAESPDFARSSGTGLVLVLLSPWPGHELANRWVASLSAFADHCERSPADLLCGSPAAIANARLPTCCVARLPPLRTLACRLVVWLACCHCERSPADPLSGSLAVIRGPLQTLACRPLEWLACRRLWTIRNARVQIVLSRASPDARLLVQSSTILVEFCVSFLLLQPVLLFFLLQVRARRLPDRGG